MAVNIKDYLVIPEPDESWAPAHYTKSKSLLTLGDQIIAFAETFMTVSRGSKKGQPLRLTEWQKWLTRMIFEQDPETGFLRYKRCIVMIPRKNGKSILSSLYCLYFLVFSKGDEQLFCAATNLRQAKIVFDECTAQVQRNPYLRRRIRVRRDYLENIANGVKLRPVPADGGALQGFAPFFTSGDEIADWPDKKVYTALTEGSADRDEWMFFGIGTAGVDKDTLLGELYEYGKKVATGEKDDAAFGFFCWEASEDDDPEDPQTWYKANPNLATGILKEADFRDSLKQADATSFNEFMQFKLNMWVRLQGLAFLSGYNWNKAMKQGAVIPKGDKIVIGFDGSRTDDATGLCILSLTSNVFTMYKTWEKPNGDENWKVPRDEVESAVDELFLDYDVQLLYGDIAYYGTDLDNWAKRYGSDRVVGMNGNAARMAPMTRDFLSDIYKGKIFHNGHDDLTRHALNAVMRENGLPGKQKRNSKLKIDFLQCAIYASGARRHANAIRRGMPEIPR